MRGRNRGDVGAHTAPCSTARSRPWISLQHSSLFLLFPKICIFLILTGNKFHAPKHGMGWMLLPSPFSCFRLRPGFAEASNLGGAAVQSNPHCGISVRPQNILLPSSSSRRRLLASDSSVDRGVFTLGRLGTHFVFVPCQLFDHVTFNFLLLQFYEPELINVFGSGSNISEMVTKINPDFPFSSSPWP